MVCLLPLLQESDACLGFQETPSWESTPPQVGCCIWTCGALGPFLCPQVEHRRSPLPDPGQAGPGPPLPEVPVAHWSMSRSWGGKWTSGPGSQGWKQRSEHLALLTLRGCQGHSAHGGLCSPANPQILELPNPRTLSHPKVVWPRHAPHVLGGYIQV